MRDLGTAPTHRKVARLELISDEAEAEPFDLSAQCRAEDIYEEERREA